MKKFDVIVLGCGPSGFAAAMRGLDMGKSVCLIEKDKVGGAGIHKGALSSKTLWELSKSWQTACKHGLCEPPNYQYMQAEMMSAVEERTNLLLCQIETLERQYQNFRFVKAHASFISDHEISLLKSDGTEEIIFGENIIIATGSRPRKLSNIPIDEKNIMTSDGIHDIESFPKSLVILGAGVIGCEFATVFAGFGQTKVFLIDKAERILPFEDEDVALTVAENLEKSGVTIHKGAALDSMTFENGQVKYVLSYKDGRKETFYVEKALISVGRIPNLDQLKIENAGLTLNERGYIADEDSRTQVPHIYVVGDTTADICLVNVGELEGRHAIKKMDGFQKKLNYENISTIMFLQPEVAGVGLNETEARKKGLPYRVARYSYNHIGRATCMRSAKGFFKILVTDDDEMKFLGMRAVGEHASSAIQGVALLMAANLGIEIMAELIHPHPSIIEGVQECARMLMGKSILKPEVFPEQLSCYKYVNGQKMPLYQPK